MKEKSGKAAYVINLDTDQPISSCRSIAAARKLAATFNRDAGKRRYKAESCDSFRRPPEGDTR